MALFFFVVFFFCIHNIGTYSERIWTGERARWAHKRRGEWNAYESKSTAQTEPTMRPIDAFSYFIILLLLIYFISADNSVFFSYPKCICLGFVFNAIVRVSFLVFIQVCALTERNTRGISQTVDYNLGVSVWILSRMDFCSLPSLAWRQWRQWRRWRFTPPDAHHSHFGHWHRTHTHTHWI